MNSMNMTGKYCIGIYFAQAKIIITEKILRRNVKIGNV